MGATVTTEQVWQAIEKQLFAVVGMVTTKNEARTVGIVYAVHQRKLYIGSYTDTWKVRHVRANPNVSVTVPITKAIPLMPWFKIPAATITFSGTARVLELDDAPPPAVHAVFRGLELDDDAAAKSSIIEIEPHGHFLTYGVGVSMMTMRKPEESHGRVPVG
ncbi:MAG: pyridoxamine 5'-phosphate oxidase family protein [Anaerolineae bacterium]|jgi:hypothetical protein